MKYLFRTLLVLLLLIGFSATADARCTKTYCILPFTALTGGGTGAMDGHTSAGGELITNDIARAQGHGF
jgi:hypothetical protein